MGFLDRRPFRADDPDGRELLAALLAAYDRAPAVREFVLAAGLPPAYFSWASAMSEVWPEVLRRAAGQGRLRSLITEVARDPDSAAYCVIARLIAEPTEEDAATGGGPGPRIGSVRRLVFEALSDDELTELCLDHFPAVYDQFAQGMSRSQRIIRLVEYCGRRGLLTNLVRLVSEINPEKYGEFAGGLDG